MTRDTLHMAFILSENIGEIDKIVVSDINSEEERLVLPEDLKSGGILNVHHYSKITKSDFDLTGLLPVETEEELLTNCPVYIGQPVGLIISRSRDRSQFLSKMAKISMKSIIEGIFDIENAISQKSFYGEPHLIAKKGNFELNNDLVTIKGKTRIN